MNTMINNEKQIDVARIKWAQRLGSLAKHGYIESCYYAPGFTPQTLLSIVGYNLIEKDGLEKLIVTRSLRNIRETPGTSRSEQTSATNSTWPRCWDGS